MPQTLSKEPPLAIIGPGLSKVRRWERKRLFTGGESVFDFYCITSLHGHCVL